ncbi:AraC family transcriptional regulator [Paenibacillus sp. GYB003]|uniref:AraC family transcriptional regulator n=1 Tax=Paenibacillus sp. GYB003 TaxID=2994392 RepID=UPI002F966652
MIRHSVPRPEAEKRQLQVKGIYPSIDYMHNHYQGKVTLETLSEIAGFTPTSYSREFKRLKGTSPIDYLNGLRIAHAKNMLLEKKHSVKEVSAASGFGNEFYFSRMFKKHVGISPTMYRNRKDIRVAAVSCLRFHEILQSLGMNPVYAANCHQTKTMNEEEHRELLGKHLNRIRETEPELIIADHYHLPYKNQLSRIAPTHILDYCMDWRTVNRRLAELIGREKEAAHHMRLLERRLREAKEILSRRFGNQTVTIMRVVHKLIRIQGAGQHPTNELIYSELGLKPGFCVPSNLMNVEFSPDKYPNLGTDHLWVQNHFYDPEDEVVYRSIQASAEWHSMKAVRSGNVRYIGNWFGMSWSTTGRMRIIDELLNM